jgi:hypothetical protein
VRLPEKRRFLLAAVVVAVVAVPIASATLPRDHAPRQAAAVAPPEAKPLPYPVPETPADASLPDATLFVAPAGSDEGSCTADAPCGSMNRAYAVAEPGQVVELAAGSYPEQVLVQVDGRSSDEAVTFRPAPEADVTLDGLTFGDGTNGIGAEHVQVRDMDVTSLFTRRTDDLTFRNLKMRAFWIEGGHGIRLIGGSVGGIKGSNPVISTWFNDEGENETPSDVVIDGVEFHDVRMAAASDHIECLHINDVDGFVVRNSVFRDCDTFDLNVMTGQNEILRDILIENNVFGPTEDSFGGNTYYGLSLRSGENVTVRNNTSTYAWAGPGENDGPVKGWTVANNIFPAGRCDDRITYVANLWIGAESCAPSDITAADPGLGSDFRLATGSPAIDAADPASTSAADIDGKPRGAAPDIGADEL